MALMAFGGFIWFFNNTVDSKFHRDFASTRDIEMFLFPRLCPNGHTISFHGLSRPDSFGFEGEAKE